MGKHFAMESSLDEYYRERIKSLEYQNEVLRQNVKEHERIIMELSVQLDERRTECERLRDAVIRGIIE